MLRRPPDPPAREATRAAVIVAIDVVSSTFGAYSLTRFRDPGKELLANLTLLPYMLAPITLIIPV